MNVAPDRFPHAWQAEVLKSAPLIAPSRHYIWPRAIVGEEDALARGALQVMVRTGAGGGFLLSCALGFTDPSMPSGIWSCPDPEEICVAAGGYVYIANVHRPESCTHISLRPVVGIHAAHEAGLLLFTGFQTIIAWGKGEQVWESPRLSWDSVKLTEVGSQEATGMGWDLVADEEVPFRVNLHTGAATGGGYRIR